MSTALTIPERPKTEIVAGFHLEVKRQVASINDIDEVDEARRRLGAWQAYVAKKEQKQEIQAAARWCEIRIGELLGKVPRGRPTKNDPTGSFSSTIPHGDRVKFRSLAEHKKLATKLIDGGQVSRTQILAAIKELSKPATNGRHTAIAGSLGELGAAEFGCIYADPPWQYGNQGTRAATRNHYDTLSPDSLCQWPVSEVAAPDAHLHLWTTNAFIQDAFRVIEAWGFEYRSCFVWVKPQMGIGNYWRVSHEFLLLGIRGNAKRFNDKSLKSWSELPRGRHSSKPEAVRGYIERASDGPYLELFGRKQVEGWTVLGNQVEERLFA